MAIFYFAIIGMFLEFVIGQDFAYHHAADMSYKYFSTAKPWDEARKTCRDEDSHLAEPKTGKEVQVLTQNWYPKDAPYLATGYHDQYKQKSYIGAKDSEPMYSALVWNDQANDAKKRCVALYKSGKISNYVCDFAMGFICEREGNDTIARTRRMKAGIHVNWNNYNSLYLVWPKKTAP